MIDLPIQFNKHMLIHTETYKFQYWQHLWIIIIGFIYSTKKMGIADQNLNF